MGKDIQLKKQAKHKREADVPLYPVTFKPSQAFMLQHMAPYEYVPPTKVYVEDPLQVQSYRRREAEKLAKEKRVKRMAKICTVIVSLVFALILTVACAGVPVFAAWGPAFLFAVYGASFLINFLVFRRGVRNVFQRLFVDGLLHDVKGFKRVLITLGFGFAVGNGIATSALSIYSFVVAMPALGAFVGAAGMVALFSNPFFIGLIATAFTVVFFLTLTSLTFDSMVMLIKNDAHKKVGRFFKNIFTRNTSVSLAQDVVEGVAKILFMALGLLVTSVAMISTLGAATNAMVTLLSLIPHASTLAIEWVSYVVVLGIAGAARLPYFFEKTATVFGHIGRSIGKGIYHGVKALFNPRIAKQQYSPVLREKLKRAGKYFVKQPAHALMYAVGAVITLVSLGLNALSNGALAAGGGTYIEQAAGGLHISLSAEDAQHDAMLASAALSATVGSAALIESGAASRADAKLKRAQAAAAQKGDTTTKPVQTTFGRRNLFTPYKPAQNDSPIRPAYTDTRPSAYAYAYR